MIVRKSVILVMFSIYGTLMAVCYPELCIYAVKVAYDGLLSLGRG